MVRNLTMEPTFYEDQAGTLYCPPVGRMMVNGPMSHGALGSIKRSNLTLDLNSARQGLSKRPSKLGSALTTPSSLPSLTPLLGSPDQLLKLATPEFERLLNQESCIITTVAPTTTPSGGLHTPTSQIYFEKAVTEEQENYALGFVEALNELHHSDSSQEPGSLHGATYTTLEPPGSVQSNESSSMLSSQGLVQIKDEPHTVPSVSSSPPMSPINMESQERIKLERKRQRNRVAASKCRRRKLERISRLEDKVKLLKGENSDLSQVASRLRDHVFKLKEQVIEHVNAGCQIQALPCTF
ncbi:transcription factor AP-1 [Copidosoma floridanum]|uniref:transcription factor AP-1 n=1 Tax=Copidosoma floridanum TaxID=29053 RepID=UPI000C6F9196|nr:transcription factor AP-1 [Copidosoma floridanum]